MEDGAESGDGGGYYGIDLFGEVSGIKLGENLALTFGL